MVEEKRVTLFQRVNPFNRLTRRTTPKPEDRTIYNPGIQEKDTAYLITGPIVYHIAYQSVIIQNVYNPIEERGIQKRLYLGREVHSEVRGLW